MHDRRVVRGNTFAALVIPVSKHPLTERSRHAAGPQSHREIKARANDEETATGVAQSTNRFIYHLEKEGR